MREIDIRAAARNLSRRVSAGTVNRKLAAISGLYTFHARHGVDLGERVTELHPGRRRRSGWKPFLYHLSKGEPERRNS